MTDDQLRSLIADAYTRRANSVEQMRRTPDSNNPFRPEAVRRERRTVRPYRDPVGEQAIGNIRRNEKRP